MKKYQKNDVVGIVFESKELIDISDGELKSGDKLIDVIKPTSKDGVNHFDFNLNGYESGKYNFNFIAKEGKREVLIPYEFEIKKSDSELYKFSATSIFPKNFNRSVLDEV